MTKETIHPFLEPGKWYDWDQAGHLLIEAMGLYPHYNGALGSTKWLWWTNNSIGHAVQEFLRNLSSTDILEFDEEANRFRIRENYEPSSLERRCVK